MEASIKSPLFSSVETRKQMDICLLAILVNLNIPGASVAILQTEFVKQPFTLKHHLISSSQVKQIER